MRKKFKKLIYIVSILLVFTLSACKKENEAILKQYFEPFNETMEIIKDQNKIVENGFS